MRNQLKIVLGSLGMVAMLGLTSTVQGVPAFARQTGLDCNSCHASPGYPTLNTFGQAFKAGGYTQANEDNLMGDGEALSIPKTFNMSMVMKMNTELGITKTAFTNQLQFPDEIAFLAGGRVGKNIGFLVESGNGPSLGNFKLVFAPELGPVRLGIVPFYTSGGIGAAYAFETLSTSNAENIRLTEGKAFTSAQQLAEWGGPAGDSTSGLGIYVWHPMGFINYTPFVSSNGIENGPQIASSFANYFRAAITPSFGGIDMAIGATYKMGQSDAIGADTQVITGGKFNYLAVDAQVMGNFGLPMAIVITYANNMDTSASGVAVAVDAQVLPDLIAVTLGYRHDLTANGTGSNGGIGIKYQITRNMRFAVDGWYNIASGDITLIPNFFGAF